MNFLSLEVFISVLSVISGSTLSYFMIPKQGMNGLGGHRLTHERSGQGSFPVTRVPSLRPLSRTLMDFLMVIIP